MLLDLWTDAQDRFKADMETAILDTLGGGARASRPFLERETGIETTVVKQDIEVTIAFNLNNPHTIQFADTLSSQLVREVTEETKKAIRQIIKRGAAGELTPLQQARRIRELVGLTDQQMVAVLNFQAALEFEGVAPALVRRRTERLYLRSLNQRARNISRTESIRSANAGQYNLWRQASEQGFLDTTKVAVKWTATEDDRTCDWCMSLDGKTVGFEEQFPGGTKRMANGSIKSLDPVLTPPIHPSCRCSLTLEFT
jgi:hypothetical protein